jgi:lysophospholipase L1-like esterase
MPARPRTTRILALAALAGLAFTGSMLVTESGLASHGTGPPAQTLPAIAAHTAVSAHHRHHHHRHHHNHHGGTPELCRVTPSHTHNHRLIVVFGASYTAGVGAPAPSASWAVKLAELLGWHAVALGVPGAGYTAPGDQHLGPLAHMLQRVDLGALHPAVVVVQAGHDDWQVPPAVEAAHVAALVRRLRAEAPHARLAFLTVFSPPHASRALLAREQAVDAAIVSAVHRADPGAVVIDPLREHWQFPRFHGGLHPDAQGHLLIAEWVARALVRAGAVPGVAANSGQHNSGQHNSGQHSAGQHSAGQHSAGQHSQGQASVTCSQL